MTEEKPKSGIGVETQGDKWTLTVYHLTGATTQVSNLEKIDAEGLHAWLGEWLLRLKRQE